MDHETMDHLVANRRDFLQATALGAVAAARIIDQIRPPDRSKQSLGNLLDGTGQANVFRSLHR